MLLPLGEVTLLLRDSGPEDARAPVLLLHGWPDTGDLWRDVTPRLTAAGYRALAPDLRGFGASSRPDGVRSYSVGSSVGDVAGLLDALDLPKVHLVGHDWGAVIAWMTAARLPERVHTLTAVSVGHPAAFRSGGWQQAARSWYTVLFQVRGLAELSLSLDDFRMIRRWTGHPDAESVAERLRDPEALTASLNIYRASMRSVVSLRQSVTLPSVSVPTLGVWSRRDPALTERQMTGSAEYVTGPWRYERFEDCGHWIPLEAPERLAALLVDFLEDH